MEKSSITTVDETRLLRINEVAKLTTLSRSCINLWVAQGRFPAPIALSATVKVWRLKHLVRWIENQSSQDDSGKSGANFRSVGVAA
jgi:predicted DNA-binding transcriptional regulator AlpA